MRSLPALTRPLLTPMLAGRLLTILLLGLLALASPVAVQAAAGALDASFGRGGKVITDFGSPFDQAAAVAIQSDGKIIAVGESNGNFALARYNPNGSLDTSFGSGGKVTTDVFRVDSARAVAIQADGKIVVVGVSDSLGSGNTKSDFALARYRPNGSLDTSFGSGGKVTTDFGSFSDAAHAVVLQRDGKIVVAGKAQIGGGYDFALARYGSNGSPDTSFGQVNPTNPLLRTGKVTTAFGLDRNSTDSANGVALQVVNNVERIVAVGSTYGRPAKGADFALARYNADGTLDVTFGTAGQVTTDFTPASASEDSTDGVQAVIIQSDGKIVAVGAAAVATYDFALARYNSNGSLDDSFGTAGKVTTDFRAASFPHDIAFDAVIQPDGKIVAAGYGGATGTNDFILARYNSNGSLDSSFGTAGQVATDFGSSFDYGSAIAIQRDGKLVVAGWTRGTSEYGPSDFALARYQG